MITGGGEETGGASYAMALPFQREERVNLSAERFKHDSETLSPVIPP